MSMQFVPGFFGFLFTGKLFRLDFVDQQPMNPGQVHSVQTGIIRGRIQDNGHTLLISQVHDQGQLTDLILQDQPVAFSETADYAADI